MIFAKWRRTVVAASVLAGSVVATSVVISPLAIADYGAVTATTAVNVRTGPGTNNSKIGVLYKGETTTQTGPSKNGWTPVKFRGKDGWICSRYLTSSSTDRESRISNNGGTGTMQTTARLNVRTGPGTSYKSLTVLAKGTTVMLTGSSSGRFVQINYGDSTAWVCRDYLVSSTGKSGSSSGSSSSSSQFNESQKAATTTARLNVRTGPSTSYKSVSVLARGATVTLTGNSSGRFVEIKYGNSTAWVCRDYLNIAAGSSATSSSSTSSTSSTSSSSSNSSSSSSGSGSSSSSTSQPTGSNEGGTGTMQTTARLNVRTGPSTSYRSLTVLARGATVTLTGKSSGQFIEIKYGNSTAWVSGDYLTTPTGSTGTSSSSSSSSSQLTESHKAVATTALMIRTQPGYSFRSLGDVPKGTVLSMTGKVSGNEAEIIWVDGTSKWVNKKYLNPVGSSSQVTTPSVPKVVATKYATTALDIRTTSGSDSKTIAEVPRGTALSLTGTVENGRAQIVYQGSVRWVTNRYLSTTAPAPTLNTGWSKGLDELTPNAKGIVHDIRANYPQIVTMYGVRQDPLPDHPSGIAVDLMLPNYKSNKALGWEIAKYLRANASRLNVQYVIFDQQIWNVARDREGWRKMADRGSDTANHIDHIHVTVKR